MYWVGDMLRMISFFALGAIFGLGISVSGMANPAKVLNFFDIFGTWDPSLAFVMGGALVTTAIGYKMVFGQQEKPAFDVGFMVPIKQPIDRRLIAGSATFGIGWGIAGFCPGGALPALGLGYVETFIFVGAMIVGLFVARNFQSLRSKRKPATA